MSSRMQRTPQFSRSVTCFSLKYYQTATKSFSLSVISFVQSPGRGGMYGYEKFKVSNLS